MALYAISLHCYDRIFSCLSYCFGKTIHLLKKNVKTINISAKLYMFPCLPPQGRHGTPRDATDCHRTPSNATGRHRHFLGFHYLWYFVCFGFLSFCVISGIFLWWILPGAFFYTTLLALLFGHIHYTCITVKRPNRLFCIHICVYVCMYTYVCVLLMHIHVICIHLFPFI